MYVTTLKGLYTLCKSDSACCASCYYMSKLHFGTYTVYNTRKNETALCAIFS